MAEDTKPQPRFKIGDRVIHKDDGPAVVTRVVEPIPLKWTGGWTISIYRIRPDYGQYDVATLEEDLRPEEPPNSPATF